MTVPSLPQQPAGPDAPPPSPETDRPPETVRPAGPVTAPPHATEAGRLLCAGTYLDARYRDRVIDELWVNEQRVAAPSLGFDAARVLAHALRARRIELAWALGIVALWLLGLVVTKGLLMLFLAPSLALAVAGWVRGDAPAAPLYRTAPAFLLRWWGRLLLAVFAVETLGLAFGAEDDGGGAESYYGESYGSSDSAFDVLGLADPTGWAGGSGGGATATQAWLAIVVFAALALCAAAQRGRFARAVTNELSPERYPDAASDPAEAQQGPRFQRIMGRVRREQHRKLITFGVTRPFCGAGTPVDTWILAVELRPAGGTRKQQPISNRVVLDRVRPLLAELRTPPQGGRPSRDRLRGLEIDECVFLPAEGLRHRDAGPDESALAEHIEGSVEEGAERRRHFLRIRVGGWDEELVVTVFVRVHTQGRILMLEVAPHVLQPLRKDFQDVDRTAHRLLSGNVLGKVTWAAARVPGSAVRSLVVVGKYVVANWPLLTGGHSADLAEGPALSVRELAAAPQGSLFQEMDASRYLKAVQDRIAHGVRQALADTGHQTDEFVQQIVNVSNGGVLIDSVRDSTFAVGEHATAQSATTTAAAPGGPERQKGTEGHGS